MRIVFSLAAVLFLTWAGEVYSHEMRPGYLRIQQTSAEEFNTLWRVPERGGMRLGIYLAMPGHCTTRGDALTWKDGGAFAEERNFTCPGGIAGHEVAIDGLNMVMTDVLARFERLDGTTQVARLTPARIEFTVTDSETWGEVASTYTTLGIEHILSGFDHLLFVFALLMLVPGLRMLFWTITSFTIAHSITLAAATLGLVHLPQQPIEAVIALSILFVAMEIVHWKQGKPGITRRWPWLVAFTFGLLHGFGFAGALSEIGLPEHAIPLALLFFNLGVEAGQLLFIAVVLLAWQILKRINWPRWSWAIPVYGIGGLAAFWTIERIAGFAS